MLVRAEKVATLTPIAAHAADATISYEKGTLTLKFAVQPEAPHRFIGLRLTGTQTGEASIAERSEEHTSELQSLMRISYAAFCLTKKIPSHPHPANVFRSETNNH